MNLKKILTGASVLAVTAVSFVSAASFSDTAGHWVAPYLDTAIEEGVIDGTKTTFRPDANITRAEITKIVVNYDNGGEDPTADDYASVASLSDVASSAWYYNHVNYAASEGIAGGYADGTFRPNQAVTRAEAAKMIAIALEVPSVDVTMPFTDVPSNEWFAPYVKVLYGNCVVNGRTPTTFAPAASVTRAEVVKMFVKSLNPGCDTVMPTSTAAPTATGVVTPNPSASTNATSDVQLSAKSPAAQSVPANAYQVPFVAIDVTASNDEDMMLTGLTVFHTGLGDEDEVKNVQVFDGAIPHGNSKNFAGDDDSATLNLMSDPIIIPKGTTKTIYVAADLGADNSTGANATAGGEHAIAVLSPANVTLVGKSTGALVPVAGTFPIVGSKMTVANINVGEVIVSLESLADDTLEAGLTNQELARVKVDAGSVEDVYLRALTLEANGVLDDGDVQNLYLELDGVKVSNVVAKTTNDFVTFDLTSTKAEGYLVKSGSAKTFKVKGDLTGPIDGFGGTDVTIPKADLYFTIDEASDVMAVGAKYGFGVAKKFLNASGTSTTSVSNLSPRGINVVGGDITFSMISEVTDIAADTDAVRFGTVKIENRSGEAIEIGDNINFDLIAMGTAQPADLEKVKLISKSGVTVLGPVDPSVVTNGGTDPLTNFGDDFIVGAGQTVEFDIIADVRKNHLSPANPVTAIQEGSQYYFVLKNPSKITITGQSSDATTGYSIKPASDLSSKNYTVKAAGIAITAKPLENDNYVAKTKDAIVWYGTIRATNVNDVKVNRLAFNVTGTATTADLKEYDLQMKVGANWVTLDSSVTPGDAITFTSLDENNAAGLVVKKGEEIEIRVVADIADTVVNGNTLTLAATATNSLTQKVLADKSLGDDLVPTVNTASSGSIYTLVTTGTFAATLDTAKTPDSAIIAAGNTTPAEVGVYKLKATNENVNVEKLTVKITEGSAMNGVGTLTSTPDSPGVLAAWAQTTPGVASTQKVSTLTFNDNANLIEGTVISFDIAETPPVGVVSVTIPAGTIEQKLDAIVSSLNTAYGAVVASRSGAIITLKDAGATVFTVASTPTITGTSSLTATAFNQVVAVAQQGTVTLSGTPKAGDQVKITVNGTVYTYNVTSSDLLGATSADDLNNIATNVAAMFPSATSASHLIGTVDFASVASAAVILNSVKDTDNNTTNQSNPITAATTTSTVTTSSIATASILDDSNSVKTVALYYTDGTPVLKKNGSPAMITGLVNDEALFEDLNLPVVSGEDKYISIRVYTNDIQDGATVQTAKSGHLISANLLLAGSKGKIVGLESGTELCVNSTLVNCTPLDTGASELDPIANSEMYLVTNNKIVAALAPTQPSSLYIGDDVEVMKVKLSDAAMDSDEAGLVSMIVKTSGVSVTGLNVVNGQGLEYVCTGYSDSALTVALPAGPYFKCSMSGEYVNSGSEIYTIRADVSAAVTDKTLTAQVAINNQMPGIDGITWLDSAAGSVQGVAVQWIDLGDAGAASGITSLTNTIRD